MLDNPFEAPRYDAEPAALAPKHFDVGSTFGDAWRAVIGDIGVVIIASMIFFSSALASIASVIGFFLFLPVLVWGWAKLVLNLKDGIAGYTDLGDGFPRYFAVLGTTLVLGVLCALLFLPYVGLGVTGAVLESGPILLAAQLVGILLGMVLVPRFAFAPFFMVDRNFSAIDAMKASWDVTSFQKLGMLLLMLLSALVAAAGFACGIGACVSVPMACVMYASAYRQMFPQPERPPPHYGRMGS